MTPRRRAIIILGLVLLLVGVIIFAIFLLRKALPTTQPTPVVEAPLEVEEFVPPPQEVDFKNPLIVAAPPETPAATGGRQIAELFAERYGSYSNQGEYQNLRDLLPVMTARYRRVTEEFLESAEADPTQAFEGVTSVRISTDVRSSDEDSAVIAVSLQQQRTSGGTTSTGYRSLRMELERVGEEWRVDTASWED